MVGCRRPVFASVTLAFGLTNETRGWVGFREGGFGVYVASSTAVWPCEQHWGEALGAWEVGVGVYVLAIGRVGVLRRCG
jgi:hypothetical protein